MKKSAILILVVALVCMLCACGRSKTPETTDHTTQPSTGTMPTIISPTIMDPTLETNIPDPSVDTSMPDIDRDMHPDTK